MTIDEALEQGSLSWHQFEKAFDQAMVNGWVRRRPTHVELTAAGIYVAKVYLNLAR